MLMQPLVLHLILDTILLHLFHYPNSQFIHVVTSTLQENCNCANIT